MSQTPRHINTDRSLKRPERAADVPRHAASSTDAKQSTGGAHNEPPRRPAQGSGRGEPPRRRNKKKKTPLWLPFAVVMAIIAVISGVVVYGVSLVNKVEDSIRPDDSTPTIEEEVKTDEEYKGDVVNILVCGIDYEEGRNYSNDPTSNDGMTDMILYVQFDIKNGALRMLPDPPQQPCHHQEQKDHPFQWKDLRRHELSDQLGGDLQRRQHRRSGRCHLRPVPAAHRLLCDGGYAGAGGYGG